MFAFYGAVLTVAINVAALPLALSSKGQSYLAQAALSDILARGAPILGMTAIHLDMTTDPHPDLQGTTPDVPERQRPAIGWPMSQGTRC